MKAEHRSPGRGWRKTAALSAAVLVAGLAPAALTASPASAALTGAVFTTNVGCSGVNENIYQAKGDVYLDGGPRRTGSAGLPEGSYFVKVTEPDGTPLGTSGSDRPVVVNSAGDFVACYQLYAITHQGDPAAPQPGFATTTNLGNEYKVWVSSDASFPNDDSKTDNFKVYIGGTPPPGGRTLSAPSVVKTADADYTTTLKWKVVKDVGQSYYRQSAGTVTPTYSITVSRDGSTQSPYRISGTLTVTNDNRYSDGTLIPIEGVTLSDRLSDGTACPVIESQPLTLTTAETTVHYRCPDKSSIESLLNGAYISYPAQRWEDPATGQLITLAMSDGSSAADSVTPIKRETVRDASVVLSDNQLPTGFNPTIADAGSATSVTYTTGASSNAVPAISWPVVANSCPTYTNIATITAADSGTTSSDDAVITVCGSVNGGHTMGFWSNSNGQSVVVAAGATNGVCNLTPYLRDLKMFADPSPTGLSATATCAQVNIWTASVIKAANASGAAMNAMLKGQSLATALGVFSSRSGTPAAVQYAKYGNVTNLGAQKVDLTVVPKPLSPATTQNTSAAFGAAPAPTCLTVQALLEYTSAQYVSPTSWYQQSKVIQGLAKDTYDSVNNRLAYSC